MLPPDEPLASLKRLRDEAGGYILSKGYFSYEFQEWHARVLAELQRHFRSDEGVLVEFRQIKFEWPLETLESLHETQVSLLAESQPAVAAALNQSKDSWFARAQERKFVEAMGQASEILAATIASIGRR